MKRKLISAALATAMVGSLMVSAVPVSAEIANEDITIGVSIWSSTDVLGSQCKRIIDKAAAALLQLPLHVSYYSIFNYFVAGSEGIKECVSGMNAPAVDIHLCCFVKSIFHEFLKSFNCIDNLSHFNFLRMSYPLRDLFSCSSHIYIRRSERTSTQVEQG